MSDKNVQTVSEFVKQIDKQRPTGCNEAYTLGYFMSFVENNMTPAMQKKMQKHVEYLKTLDR